jgi:hypothetical protein
MLKHNKSLTLLDLGWNRLDFAAANELKDGLIACPSLTHLVLKSNRLGNEGNNIIILIEYPNFY